ncbi:hypothetical protein ACFSJW_21605 [Flavobacterium artemisiae]|uniref:Lipocalin-like domain-containing protein n=1 Tax=Flavobacterium artemisiae TaxID=2126556 RepID=A0ABW4HAR8_9FLAO
MKKMLLLIALVVISSCSNDDAATTSQKNLQGKWKWTGSSGGFAGTTVTPKPDEVIVIEFSGSNYRTYKNGALISDAPFEIKTESSIFGDDRPTIVSSNPDKYFIRMSFSFEGNKLFLAQECYDCFGSSYVRVK